MSEPETATDETTEPNETTEPETDEETEEEPDGDEEEVEAAAEPTEPEAVETPQMDEKEIAKAFKALDKLREHVARRVDDIMGEDALQLIPCPACQDVAPGYVWPPNIFALSPEAEAGTRLLLGMQQPTDLEPHPAAAICETCNGKGQVQTPSKVPGYDVVDCPTCAATGRILTSNVVQFQFSTGSVETQPVVTGPTTIPTDLPPEAQALKDAGWMVVPPFNPAASPPAAV